MEAIRDERGRFLARLLHVYCVYVVHCRGDSPEARWKDASGAQDVYLYGSSSFAVSETLTQAIYWRFGHDDGLLNEIFRHIAFSAPRPNGGLSIMNNYQFFISLFIVCHVILASSRIV